MSKFDYEEETKLHVAYYNRGRKEERERIMKIIDKEIEMWEGMHFSITAETVLRNLKEELKK